MKFSPDGATIASNVIGTAAVTDGSTPTRWIGRAVAGHTLLKAWLPDGAQILLCVCDRNEV